MKIKHLLVALAAVVLAALAAGFFDGDAGAQPTRGAKMDAASAIEQAAVSHGLITKTANTATAPADPSAPAYLYAATSPVGDPVYTLTARLTFDSPEGDFATLPAGAMVIDAKVFMVQAFDSTDANTITFTSTAGSGVDFAVCQDASVSGGGQVDGIPGAGVGTEFVPVYSDALQSVHAFYSAGSGTADQGIAIAVISYVIAGDG